MPAPTLARPATTVRASCARLWETRSRGELGFLLAMLVANGSNLVFHAVATRMLGPASYGALGALLVLLTAATLPAAAMQTLLAAEVLRRTEAGQAASLRRSARACTTLGIGTALAIVPAAGPLADYLHLSSPWPALLLGGYLLPLAAGIAPYSQLVGTRRFGAVAGAALLGVGVRIVLGVFLLTAGTGVSGAVVATGAGEAATVAALRWAARRAPVPPGTHEVTLRVGHSLGGAWAVGGLWLLMGLDTVLSRHFLPADSAGRYAAAATVARAAFFLPQALSVAALPGLSSVTAGVARRALRRTLLLSAVLGLGMTAGLTAVGPLLLPRILGRGFNVEALLLLLLGLATTGFALLNVGVQYHLAQGNRRAALPWLGVLALPPAAALFHGSGTVLAATAALVAWTTSLGAILGELVHRGATHPPRASLTEPTARSGSDGAPSALDLTVVVPYYNPGDALRPLLLNLVAALHRAGVRFEVVAVEDGCTDGSAHTIADLPDEHVRRVSLDRNCGKGQALRVGLQAGRGRYLGFIDGDGDLEPDLWEPFLTLVRLYRPDAVVGSKRHPLSEVDETVTLARRLASWGYQELTRVLFRLPVRDTQVGIKVFRRELLTDVLPHTQEVGFVFDLEVLAVARDLGYRRIMPAPVRIRSRERSTVRASTVVVMLRDTLRLAWRLHVLAPHRRARPGVVVASDRLELSATGAPPRMPLVPALPQWTIEDRRAADAAGQVA